MSQPTYFRYLDSPLGELLIAGDGQHLTHLYMPNHKHAQQPDASWQQTTAPFSDVVQQLQQYFAGEREDFDLPIRAAGTAFQQRVWQELSRIPFGVTITYGELARRVGQPNASRAVGSANGRNPISIIVPCHRVIGTDGRLTGYGGGLENKRWLLDWERGDRPLAFAAASQAFVS